jgi:hypothetical protein
MMMTSYIQIHEKGDSSKATTQHPWAHTKYKNRFFLLEEVKKSAVATIPNY